MNLPTFMSHRQAFVDFLERCVYIDFWKRPSSFSDGIDFINDDGIETIMTPTPDKEERPAADDSAPK